MAFIARVCHALLIMGIQPSSQALSISAFMSLLVEQLNVWAKSCLSRFKPISTLVNTHTHKKFISFLLTAAPFIPKDCSHIPFPLLGPKNLHLELFMHLLHLELFIFYFHRVWMTVFLNRHLYLKFYFYRPRICTKVFMKTFISTLKVLHSKYQATNLGQWNKAFLNSCIRNEADTQGMTWRQRE